MNEEQTLLYLTPEGLLPQVETFQKDGYRLVQMTALTAPGETGATFELDVSFEKNAHLTTLRISAPLDTELPSITALYPCAYLYENEIREHFGLKIRNISVDFRGSLYRVPVPFPFLRHREKA